MIGDLIYNLGMKLADYGFSTIFLTIFEKEIN